MLLRPLPITRVANCAPAFLVASLLALFGASIGEPFGVALALVAVASGVWLYIRANRMAVRLDGDKATIFGQVRTVVIRRHQIERITAMPAIVWRDHKGRRHWSPVIPLTSSTGSFRRFQHHAESDTSRLRKWAEKK